MHETKINTGASEGIPFGEALPEANGGLESVRATLDHKTRLARQYGAVEALIEAGLSPAQIVSLTPEDLERVDHVDSETKDAERIHIFVDDAFGVSVDAEPIHECIEMATKKSCLTGDDDPLFRTPEGDPIDESMFDLLR
jgi:hypothetical protein